MVRVVRVCYVAVVAAMLVPATAVGFADGQEKTPGAAPAPSKYIYPLAKAQVN